MRWAVSPGFGQTLEWRILLICFQLQVGYEPNFSSGGALRRYNRLNGYRVAMVGDKKPRSAIIFYTVNMAGIYCCQIVTG